MLTVETPDDNANRMVNTWNPYQCMVTFNISRSVSLFDPGSPGALAATQLVSGGAYHQYQPLTKSGNDAIGSGLNDDPLWLVLGVAAYLKETGDEAILDEPVPYADAPDAPSPLYEHLERSLRYILDRLGPHLLPLIEPTGTTA